MFTSMLSDPVSLHAWLSAPLMMPMKHLVPPHFLQVDWTNVQHTSPGRLETANPVSAQHRYSPGPLSTRFRLCFPHTPLQEKVITPLGHQWMCPALRIHSHRTNFLPRWLIPFTPSVWRVCRGTQHRARLTLRPARWRCRRCIALPIPTNPPQSSIGRCGHPATRLQTATPPNAPSNHSSALLWQRWMNPSKRLLPQAQEKRNPKKSSRTAQHSAVHINLKFLERKWCRKPGEIWLAASSSFSFFPPFLFRLLEGKCFFFFSHFQSCGKTFRQLQAWPKRLMANLYPQLLFCDIVILFV